MQNVGHQEFTYDTFKAIYDANPKIADIVASFDKDTITLKTNSVDDINPSKDTSGRNKIRQMARRAVDI